MVSNNEENYSRNMNSCQIDSWNFLIQSKNLLYASLTPSPINEKPAPDGSPIGRGFAVRHTLDVDSPKCHARM